MNMKWLFFTLIPVLIYSCIDFDRSKHIEEIDTSIEELNHSTSDLNDPLFDSIPIVISHMNRLNERIRTYIKQDTLSLETALKIDEYKSLEAEIIQLSEQIPVAKKDINQVVSDLKNLKKDISSNAGDRANYNANIALEQASKKVLVDATHGYTTTFSTLLIRFNSLHTALWDYSIQLEMKNKEQNLIP